MKKQKIIKNVYLLYNFDFFVGFFYYKKQAIEYIKTSLLVSTDEDWNECYQIYKGSITPKIY